MVPSAFENFYFILIILLLLLSIIGLYIYFKSRFNQQNNAFEEQINEVKNQERNQKVLLSNMSDNIYQLTQNLVDPEKTKDEKIETEIVNSANNLRELLKIQTDNVEIYNEKFVFSHMLDDISTYLSSNFSNIETEVIFDINPNVPRYLNGDIIHFSRILNNILEFCIQKTPYGKVTLTISCDNCTSENIILNVRIKDNAKGIKSEQRSKLFELVYDEEKQKHTGLGLYIAKKLTLAIGGTIELDTTPGLGNIFTLQIPMKLNDASKLQEFKTFKEGIESKRVLIYSDKSSTGHSLKKLFSYFYAHVKVASREQLDKRVMHFKDFDLIVLDDIFFNNTNNEYIKRVKEEQHLHIVAFSSIFSGNTHEENYLVDSYIHTPSNLERLVELISQFDPIKEEESPVIDVPLKLEKDDGTLLVYKDAIEETDNIDIDCFTYFKGAKLLIVEDNLINQKIILSVLKKSGMDIELANNGQEALDILSDTAQQFDIVLMDISMPIMDGLVATKHIRANKAFDSMPIITFTAFAMGSEIEEMFDAGCNAYLTKPLNIKKLYRVFEMFLPQTQREVSLHKSIEIEGLDIEKGIYNADESEILYKETLKEFVLVYQDMAEQVPKWIKEKSYERVKLAGSEIQGILDAIGAYEMKSLVDEMQKNFLYSNEQFLDKYILLYPEKFNSLIETINHYLKTKSK